MFALLAIALTITGGLAAAEESLLEAIITPLRQKDIVPVNNKQYKDECGSCHFAYQPGLLPAKSWEKLLTPEALSKHFGENAELDNDTLTIIYNYAIANAQINLITSAPARSPKPQPKEKLRYASQRYVTSSASTTRSRRR